MRLSKAGNEAAPEEDDLFWLSDGLSEKRRVITDPEPLARDSLSQEPIMDAATETPALHIPRTASGIDSMMVDDLEAGLTSGWGKGKNKARLSERLGKKLNPAIEVVTKTFFRR